MLAKNGQGSDELALNVQALSGFQFIPQPNDME
jgi:hypothetical protein